MGSIIDSAFALHGLCLGSAYVHYRLYLHFPLGIRPPLHHGHQRICEVEYQPATPFRDDLNTDWLTVQPRLVGLQ